MVFAFPLASSLVPVLINTIRKVGILKILKFYAGNIRNGRVIIWWSKASHFLH